MYSGSFLSFDRDFEMMEMIIHPRHDILYGHVEIIERIAFRDLDSSPDWRIGAEKSELELIDFFARPPTWNG
jgi:hypothetical protein